MMNYLLNMPKISIVVPVYFNEKNLPTTIPALLAVLGRHPDLEGELILVDDGSQDASFEIAKTFAAKEPRIRLIRLAKNFGAHTALLAGLDEASGDCIAFIMADLQDPPELIDQMIAHWQGGEKIVLAERTNREDRFIDRIFASVFWLFMRRFAIKNLPKGGFDFVLFDRAVADVIRTSREKNSHIMAQIFWTGFPAFSIPYTRRERQLGSSKWTFTKKVKLFIDSAISFSYVPVRAMSFLGILTACLGFLFALYILIGKLSHGTPVQGWTSLTIIVLILGGLQMMMLGLIGEYVWRTYDETRRRPSYIVAEKINARSTISSSQ
jgi:glycosyltransferase involved in cell wall biosynthesis